MFTLRQDKVVFWASNGEGPVPQYLTDSIDQVPAIISENHQTNEAFSRTIIDQILVSAVYEEKHTQATQQRALVSQKFSTVLELQHETQSQRQVLYGGETKPLNGYTD